MKLAFIPVLLLVFPYASAFSRRQNSQAGAGANPQTSTTLDPSVIATAFANNGITPGPNPENESPSTTSSNNFINFCVGKTLTNGQQNSAGSCNVTPAGDLPPASSMPSCQFQNPRNGAVIAANNDLLIVQQIFNLATGFASNATVAYQSAPQQLNGTLIAGHSHVVIQDVTKLSNPQEFVFFKALNFAAVDGKLNTTVSGGLPPGDYRACSLLTTMNHTPVQLPIAQHGSSEDCVRFTATANGGGSGNGGNSGNGADTNPSSSSGVADVKIFRGGKRRFAREIA